MDITAITCGACGALVADDYWTEHEQFHARSDSKPATQGDLNHLGTPEYD